MELQDNLDEKTIKFFRENEWIEPDEEILALEKAGDGNMNFVRRLVTNKRSFIIKQSMAYVYKYPEIAAPIDRIFMEKAYYDLLNQFELLDEMSPEVIDLNKENHLILLRDLGPCESFSDIYSSKKITEKELSTLIQYLVKLHNITGEKYPDNIKMRDLNHEHIFEIPFDPDNEIEYENIQEGLRELALKYQSNQEIKDQVKVIGKTYLSFGKTLIHGDYHPGSWLKLKGQQYIIDPEFSFKGFPEFDLGVMVAHLKMAKIKEAQINKALEEYKLHHEIDEALLYKVAGIEILRRLFGVAQLPLDSSIDQKSELAELAKTYIL